MPDRVEYRGLSVLSKGLANQLVSPVKLVPVSTVDKTLLGAFFDANALWDTGAEVTCISPALQDRLKLYRSVIDERTTLVGIGGSTPAELAIVSILLADGLQIELCQAYVVDFMDDTYDMIIGMDIITMGDFAVCNADSKTSFSFARPPFPDKINLAAKAEAANTKNKE